MLRIIRLKELYRFLEPVASFISNCELVSIYVDINIDSVEILVSG